MNEQRAKITNQHFPLERRYRRNFPTNVANETSNWQRYETVDGISIGNTFELSKRPSDRYANGISVNNFNGETNLKFYNFTDGIFVGN